MRCTCRIPTQATAISVIRRSRKSSHVDLIIPVVEAALVNANFNPPETTAELLAELRVKQKFGVMPSRPPYEEGLKKWNARSLTKAPSNIITQFCRSQRRVPGQSGGTLRPLACAGGLYTLGRQSAFGCVKTLESGCS